MEIVVIVVIGALLVGTTGLAWFLAHRANREYNRIVIEGLKDVQYSLDAANESLQAANEFLRATLEESQVNGK